MGWRPLSSSWVVLLRGVVDLSVFFGRMGEFREIGSSGFMRFVGPFWLLSDYFSEATLREILVGNGPGTLAAFAAQDRFSYSAGATPAMVKLPFEYGLIGVVVYILFLTSCVHRTLCPRIIAAALIFTFIFLGGGIIATPYQTIFMVLVTLNSRSSPFERSDPTGRYYPAALACS